MMCCNEGSGPGSVSVLSDLLWETQAASVPVCREREILPHLHQCSKYNSPYLRDFLQYHDAFYPLPSQLWLHRQA